MAKRWNDSELSPTEMTRSPTTKSILTASPSLKTTPSPPPKPTYETLLQALNTTTSLPHLKHLHALILTNGLSFKSVLSCRLISSYATHHHLHTARQLFDHLPHRTTHAYNHLLKPYINLTHPKPAFTLYSHMLSDPHAPPDPVTFSLILKACAASRAGTAVHAHALITGCVYDLRLATDILCFYSKCGRLDFARRQFDVMPDRDAFVWTVMIDAYLRSGEYNEAMCLFSRMRGLGLRASVVTWNAVIAGFARDGLVSDALCLIRIMQMEGVRADDVTLSAVLPLFARSAVLKPGVEVHGYAIRNGFEVGVFVVSALVDMYAKCGKLGLARRMFDRAEVRDTGVWNAIIAGYGMHGHCGEALALFDEMIVSGIRPNEISFASVLSACSHGGFLREGRRIFHQMVVEYKIVARHEHYTCLVDMFGRAGQLEEASEVIRSMPFEASEDIWSAFWSAFRIHCDKKSVKIATKGVTESNGTLENAGHHVMMSNIYAQSGQWTDVAKLRTQIRDARLKRRTGYSWIEVGDNVCTFSMADMSNPRSDEICSLLRNLNNVISSRYNFSELYADLM